MIFFPSWFRDFKVYFQKVANIFRLLAGLWYAWRAPSMLDPCVFRPWKKSQGFEHLCSRICVSAESNQEVVAELLNMVAPTRMHKHRNATTHVCFEFFHTEVVGCIFEYFCCGWLGVSWKKLFKPVQMAKTLNVCKPSVYIRIHGTWYIYPCICHKDKPKM